MCVQDVPTLSKGTFLRVPGSAFNGPDEYKEPFYYGRVTELTDL